MRAPAPRYIANDGVIDAASAALGDMLVEATDLVGEVSLTVDREALVAAMTTLRDTPGLEYQQCMEIAGVDYPSRPDRFDVVYCLLSLTRNHRIRVRVITDEVKPVPSVTGLWPNAGWLEREVYDMYGVLFSGNPDLRRILTDYGFRGHPQRKDFPLSGYVELRYSEEAKRVVYQPVSLAQDFRNFDFMSPWEGAAYVLPGDEKAPPAPPAAPAPPPAAAAAPPPPPPPPPPPTDAPREPQAKGAPSPVTADELQKADTAAAEATKADAPKPKVTETPADTGEGKADPGDKPKRKPRTAKAETPEATEPPAPETAAAPKKPRAPRKPKSDA